MLPTPGDSFSPSPATLARTGRWPTAAYPPNPWIHACSFTQWVNVLGVDSRIRVSWVLDLLNETLTIWSEARPTTAKQMAGALKQRLVDAPAARGQGRE
jgi:hypothetical protein